MSGKAKSLADQAYETIKRNILNLTYPPGMPLTEAKLAEELGMSRSPVRTALRMLQTDGLIVTDYYKSMTVKEITEEDINQIYQLRELIELPAFKLIFDSGKYEEFSYRIEEKVVRMCAVASDPFAWEIADIAFHMEIVSIYENERIDRIYHNNLSELTRMGVHSVKNGMEIQQTNDHLKDLVEYMRQGDYEHAVKILKDDHFGTGRTTAMSK